MDERRSPDRRKRGAVPVVDDKIERLNEAFGVVAESMAVVCECGRLDCTEQIGLDLPTYEHVRADPTHFVLIPGHEELDVETIVEEHDAFDIVRKDPGGPADLARELA